MKVEKPHKSLIKASTVATSNYTVTESMGIDEMMQKCVL